MSRHEDDGGGREGLAGDTSEEREINRLLKQIRFYASEVDALSREKITLRNALDEKTRLYDRLRKITSYIPGRLMIEAKEKAGFGDNIKLMESDS